MFAHFRVDAATILLALDARTPVSEPIPSSREIEFTPEVQRILHGAREEADGLEHRHIGSEHLVLAMLRENGSIAASILSDARIAADEARAFVAKLLQTSPSVAAADSDAIDAAVGMIKSLVNELSGAERNSPEAENLVARIHQALDGLRGGHSGALRLR